MYVLLPGGRPSQGGGGGCGGSGVGACVRACPPAWWGPDGRDVLGAAALLGVPACLLPSAGVPPSAAAACNNGWTDAVLGRDYTIGLWPVRRCVRCVALALASRTCTLGAPAAASGTCLRPSCPALDALRRGMRYWLYRACVLAAPVGRPACLLYAFFGERFVLPVSVGRSASAGYSAQAASVAFTLTEPAGLSMWYAKHCNHKGRPLPPCWRKGMGRDALPCPDHVSGPFRSRANSQQEMGEVTASSHSLLLTYFWYLLLT
ncbi:hypothetical protein DFH27DRAFT_528242 [Peziza echinospora]|nr:hypothetical protein DFH27DRAFT_528242 [Peziza echinospora]